MKRELPAVNEEDLHTIYLAGGCFWGVEAYLQKLPGVYDTEVGYANGATEHPTYEQVCCNNTGHASIGPFDDGSKLCNEVMAQCAYMLNTKTITQADAMLVLEVAANIQSGNTEGYKQEPTQDDAYATWNIVKEAGAYYYQNERVRILVDVKEDRSFSNFHYDGQGVTDIRLIRGHNGEIEKIESLTPAEAKEILSE